MSFAVFALPILTIGAIGLILAIALAFHILPSKYEKDHWKIQWYPLFTIIVTLGLMWAWVYILEYLR